MQEAYPHWAKYTTKTSKKKPCRKCHPNICAEAKERVENNPEITIKQSKKQKNEYEIYIQLSEIH